MAQALNLAVSLARGCELAGAAKPDNILTANNAAGLSVFRKKVLVNSMDFFCGRNRLIEFVSKYGNLQRWILNSALFQPFNNRRFSIC